MLELIHIFQFQCDSAEILHQHRRLFCLSVCNFSWGKNCFRKLAPISTLVFLYVCPLTKTPFKVKMPVEMKRNHQKTQSKSEHLWLVQWLLKTIDGGGVSLAKYLTHLSPIIALNKLRIHNNKKKTLKICPPTQKLKIWGFCKAHLLWRCY